MNNFEVIPGSSPNKQESKKSPEEIMKSAKLELAELLGVNISELDNFIYENPEASADQLWVAISVNMIDENSGETVHIGYDVFGFVPTSEESMYTEIIHVTHDTEGNVDGGFGGVRRLSEGGIWEKIGKDHPYT